MMKWSRVSRFAIAHVWGLGDWDLVYPICETAPPEHEYMLEWVESEEVGVTYCEQCQALDNPVSYRQNDLALDYSPCLTPPAESLPGVSAALAGSAGGGSDAMHTDKGGSA